MNDDLISRKAAIDALHTWFKDGFDEDKWWNSTHVLAAIEGLPTVQQEHKWETCFDCPLSHGCPKIKDCTNEQAIEYASQIPNDCPLSAQPESEERTAESAQNVPKEDLISRKVAIDALDKHLRMTDVPVSYPGIISALTEWLNELPFAQPEPIRINLNEPIKVKLTDWGKEIYYHQYDRTNQIAGREICKPRFPREDENGYTEFQLWCFMELYGEHIGMTLPNVIEPLEIVYER